MGRHQWLKWFYGYLIVIVKGKRMERLINRAVQRDMHIWNVTRFGEDRGKISIRLSDFFLLRPLLKETGCRTRIISKHGSPFFFKRVKRRFTFFVGSIVFIIMLFFLSKVIWTVEVVGTDKISETDVLLKAQQLGIEQWKFSFMLDDPMQIQADLLAKIPEASWLGIQIKGTKAEIRIVEKIHPEEKEKLSPRHLVASKSAVIYDIFADQGQPVVRPDDFVRKGDILVSGLIGKEDSPVQVSAQGKVEGEVWYETEVMIPTQRNQTFYTGEKHRNIYFLIGEKQFKLWGFKDVPFNQYKAKDSLQTWQQNDKGVRVGWKVEELLAIDKKQLKISVEEAQELAKVAAKQDVISKMKQGGYVKDEKVLLQREENDKVYIRMYVVAIEDIAVEQPIYLEGE